MAVVLAVSLGLTTVATRIYGSDKPVDIGIQSSTDVEGELAPCG